MKTRFNLFGIIGFSVVLLAASVASHASWKKVAQFAVKDTKYPPVVRASYFFNEQHGIIGLDGFNGIYLTTDGGTTWQASVIPQGYTGFINDIFMTDTLNGWACVESTSLDQFGLWKTSDGGVSWDSIPGFSPTATGVYQHDNVVIVSDRTSSTGLYLSTDGGQTFTKLGKDKYTGLAFSDANHGVAAAFVQGTGNSYAAPIYTSDGGLTWSQSIGMLTEAWSVYAARGTQNFYVVGERQLTDQGPASFCHRSTDNGKTWKSISVIGARMTGHIAGVGAVMYVQGWTSLQMPTNPQGLFRSIDGGLHWDSVGGPSNYRDTRFSVTGCGGQVVYAFDEDGGVWKTRDGGDGLMSDSLSGRIVIDAPDSLFAAQSCFGGDTAVVRFGTLSCDTLIVDSIVFADPSQPTVTSGAVALTDGPALPARIWVGMESLQFLWTPHLLDTKPHSTDVVVRIHGRYALSSAIIDTSFIVNVRTPGNQPAGIPDTLSFGSVFAGQKKCLSLTLRNTAGPQEGSVPITLATYANPDTSIRFSSSTPKLPLSLHPGDSVTLEFCFSPTDSAYHTAMFGIEDNCYEYKKVVLTGQGLSTAGVAGEEQADNLVIQPNPIGNILRAEFRSKGGQMQLQVFDLLGRKLISQPVNVSDGQNSATIDTHQLAPGKYWLQLGNDRTSFIKE